MGQISMKILCLPGSLLSANQHRMALCGGADQRENVVATGRRRGGQRGQNDFGLSAIIQPCPGRSFAMKGPARSPGRAVAAEGDDVSRAPRG